MKERTYERKDENYIPLGINAGGIITSSHLLFIVTEICTSHLAAEILFLVNQGEGTAWEKNKWTPKTDVFLHVWIKNVIWRYWLVIKTLNTFSAIEKFLE